LMFKNKILKMLTHGTVEEDIRSDIVDESRASRENQSFVDDSYKNTREEGGIFVYIHDDHEKHLEHHTDLAKSEEATQWPDKKWKDLNAHIEEHYLFYMLLKQMQAQQQMQNQQPAALPVEEGGMGAQPGPIPEEGEMGTDLEAQPI